MPDVQTAQGAGSQVDDSAVVQRTLIALRRMRNFRRQYDARKAYWYRQYLNQRDARFYPDGLTARSNTSVPYPRSNVETVVSRTLDAFFSIDPPIEVRGRAMADQAAAPKMQAVLLQRLHESGWIGKLELLLRNICIYGHAGIMVDWDWDYDTVTAPDPVFAMQPVIDQATGQPQLDQNGQPVLMPLPNPMTGEPIQIGTQVTTKNIPRMRPRLTPIDVFDLLIDPDGGIVARLFEKTLAQLLRESQVNPSLYDPDAVAELAHAVSEAVEDHPEAVLIRFAECWDETNNTVTLITFGEDAEAVSWKDLRYSYRNANYSTYKRKVYGGQPILLKHGPNPFIHKKAPILYTSYTKLTGEPYGIGVIESISELSEALSKFCNMITDNWNLGINRRYVFDVNADIDMTALNQFNVPGGKIGVNGDPSKVVMPLPTMTPSPAEFSIMELYKELISLGSGIDDFYGRGIGGPKGNRTSSGIGQAITESNYVFRMFIRNFETDILQPMSAMVASMIQQFMPDYVEFQITGEAPGIPKVGRVALEEIIGNFDFDFVAANYATNKVVRQRNLMAFYQLASQTPYANQGEFLRELGKVMEIPNANRLVKPDQQVMMEQQQSQQLQLRMTGLEKLLETESKMLIAEASKAEPNSVTAHAKLVQETVEELLQAVGELPHGGPPTAKAKEGRPSPSQPEGKIPGGGHASSTRSMAQDMGSNAMGLGGLSSEAS